MKGNIYTRQKCRFCNDRMVHIETKSGCFCQKHKEEKATGQFYVKFGKEINRRFKTYHESARFLTGLRYETDNGTFDVRDHMSSNPLGFSNLAEQYLSFKEKLKLKSFYHIECYINKASKYFGSRNVKTVKKKDIRSFLDTLNVSDKTKSNYCSQLHDMFYNYLYEEIEALSLDQLPKFPKIDYELGFRKIIGIQDREIIINNLKEETYSINPKIWLAVDILCSYNKLRPGDIRTIREGDIDLEYGVLTIWRPTKRKRNRDPKVIRERLLDYHLDEIIKLKKEYPATDGTLFFRHNGKSQAVKDTPFGVNFLYKQWKKVCKDHDIHDLDLYGAVRHSTTTAIAKVAGKRKAQKFNGDTNKAFARYCQIADEDSFDMTKLMAKMRGKVVKIQPKKAHH